MLSATAKVIIMVGAWAEGGVSLTPNQPAIPMAVFPLRVKRSQAEKDVNFNRYSDFVIRNRRPILWLSSAVVIVLAVFITNNRFNDKFVDYFDHRIQFRNDSEFAMAHLTGIYNVEHSLGAGESSGISMPEYLNKLEEFEAWYRKQPGVLQVNSFSHVMKRLNKSMHGDDPAAFRIPDNRELTAQKP